MRPTPHSIAVEEDAARVTRPSAFPASPAGRDLVERVVDPGTFREWNDAVPDPRPRAGEDPTYREKLEAARARTGLDEAVLTGEALLAGRRVAIIVGEFGFLGGSIGMAASERIVLAVERATRRFLPLLATTASGGTRMQEGTAAFWQMIKISAAISEHRRARLPYLSYLRHPTTGGVFASWASQAHVVAAEPGALVGFLGPRVYGALYDQEFPEGVQTAENLAEHGLIDAVVSADRLRAVAIGALDTLAGRPLRACPPANAEASAQRNTVWESIQRTRRPERPGVRELLHFGAASVTPLHGTGAGESESSVLLALAQFGGSPCVVVGQDRHGAHPPMGPKGLRTARRGVRLSDDLGIPLVTVVDTAGAALSQEAEEGGLAGEIARSIADLVTVRAPTVCLLLGEGAGGGALALMATDRVICAEHGWLSPLPLEGASAIRFGTVDHAAEMAAAQRVGSFTLRTDGIVHRILAERPDAADEPVAFCRRVGSVLAAEIASLSAHPLPDLLRQRRHRHRTVGTAPAGSGPADCPV